MKTKAIIERTKDGMFNIFTPDIKTGVIGTGESVNEAKKDFDNSINEILEYCSEKNVPCELDNIEFEYYWDIAAVLNKHSDWINISGLAKELGINSSLMRQYKAGNYISEEQAIKILQGIQKKASELMSIQLK